MTIEMTIYQLMWFDPIEKRIQSIVRKTEKEIYREMLCLMQSIPHMPYKETVDYNWGDVYLGANEHNGWLEDTQNREWFFNTTCIYLTKEG